MGEGDVVSMLTRLGFKRLQNRARGCNQVPSIPRPLHRQADDGTVHIQSTGHLASGDRQLPSGNIANQSASACDLCAGPKHVLIES